MNVTDIQTLYAYNRWANERLFSALEKLNERQFTAAIQSSFPSIRETVFHILFAEWLWLKRWQGTSPRSTLADPDASPATWSTLTPGGTPTMKELETLPGFEVVCGLHRAAAAGVSDADLTRNASRAIAVHRHGGNTVCRAPGAIAAAPSQSQHLSPRPGHNHAAANRRRSGLAGYVVFLPGEQGEGGGSGELEQFQSWRIR